MYFTSPHVSRSKKQAFGLQIGSQNFRIASRQKRDAAEDIRVKFDLPTFSLTGRHDGEHIHCLALVEYFLHDHVRGQQIICFGGNIPLPGAAL